MKKTQLKTKTPLKATSSLKKTDKKRPKAKVSILTKKADTVFSRYIRLRDSSYTGRRWVGRCITCKKQLVILADESWNRGTNVGHFISRGCKELRYDEFNCNLQCARCNAWEDKETMQENYRKGIVDKYGDDILKELKVRSKVVRGLTVGELEQILADYTTELNHMLEHPDLYRK